MVYKPSIIHCGLWLLNIGLGLNIILLIVNFSQPLCIYCKCMNCKCIYCKCVHIRRVVEAQGRADECQHTSNLSECHSFHQCLDQPVKTFILLINTRHYFHFQFILGDELKTVSNECQHTSNLSKDHIFDQDLYSFNQHHHASNHCVHFHFHIILGVEKSPNSGGLYSSCDQEGQNLWFENVKSYCSTPLL